MLPPSLIKNYFPISDGSFDHGYYVTNHGKLSSLSTQPLESANRVCTLTNGSMALALGSISEEDFLFGSMSCSLNCSMNCQGLEDVLLSVC